MFVVLLKKGMENFFLDNFELFNLKMLCFNTKDSNYRF